MNDVGTLATSHPIILIMIAVVPALIRALREDVEWFKSWPAGARLAVLGALTAVGTACDQIQNGTNVTNAFVAAGAVALPSLIIEFSHWLKNRNGPPPGGTGTIDLVAEAKKKELENMKFSIPSKFLRLALVVGILAALPSCAAIRSIEPALNDAQAAVGDAGAILQTIRSVVSIFFLAHPAPEVQTKVEQAMSHASLTLSVAVRSLRGAQSVSAQQMDSAWGDFRGAYAELITLLKNAGIVPKDGKLGAGKDAIVLPEPLALGKLN